MKPARQSPPNSLCRILTSPQIAVVFNIAAEENTREGFVRHVAAYLELYREDLRVKGWTPERLAKGIADNIIIYK